MKTVSSDRSDLAKATLEAAVLCYVSVGYFLLLFKRRLCVCVCERAWATCTGTGSGVCVCVCIASGSSMFWLTLRCLAAYARGARQPL